MAARPQSCEVGVGWGPLGMSFARRAARALRGRGASQEESSRTWGWGQAPRRLFPAAYLGTPAMTDARSLGQARQPRHTWLTFRNGACADSRDAGAQCCVLWREAPTAPRQRRNTVHTQQAHRAFCVRVKRGWSLCQSPPKSPSVFRRLCAKLDNAKHYLHDLNQFRASLNFPRAWPEFGLHSTEVGPTPNQFCPMFLEDHCGHLGPTHFAAPSTQFGAISSNLGRFRQRQHAMPTPCAAGPLQEGLDVMRVRSHTIADACGVRSQM